MAQYLFKNRGRGLSQGEARTKLESLKDLALDRETEQQLIVSGPEKLLKQFMQELRGWFAAPIKTVRRPAIGAARHPRVHRVR